MNRETEISWQLKLLLQLINISLEGSAGDAFENLMSEEDIVEGLSKESGVADFVSLVKKQKLIVPVYEAIVKSTSNSNTTDNWGETQEALNKIKDSLNRPFYSELLEATAQDEQIEAVIGALDEAGVDSMPLKGWVVRSIYPSRLMRSMVDFDILIREFDEEKITGALESIGYRMAEFTGGKHEHYIGRGGLTVEVHRRLTERADYVNEWEAKSWKRAKLADGRHSTYSMSPEDMYVFHLLHMEWDITHGALPLRAICDMHRFSVAYGDMDKSYIDEELGRLEISDFARKMERLTDVCFRGAPQDEETMLLLEFYTRESMLGTAKRNALSRAAMNTENNPTLGLFKSRLHSVFAPRSFMKEQFPVLERRPYLLPLYRIKRLFVMIRRYRADSFRRDYDDLSRDEMKEMQEVLKAAGINENHF